jgi:hypothetical protein
MLRRSFTIFVFIGLSLSGCATPARYLSRESTGGIVAIDSNTNSWPSYNRKRAEELMAAHFPGGYEIIREDEVVVGQTTTNNTLTNRETQPTWNPLVDKEQVTTTQTSSTQDRTEWRIYYRPKTFTTSTLPQEGKSIIPASNLNTEGMVSPETFPDENGTSNDPRAPKRTNQQMNPFKKNPDMLPNGGRSTRPTLNIGN